MTQEILQAAAPDHIAMIRRLFREYQAYLNVDLCFQSFEQELATLPGKYAPPSGSLLLALEDGEPTGCVAVRPLKGTLCEMKRLYVRPGFRGSGLGRRLGERVVREAASLGYAAMRLDTLRRLEAARDLYESMGFREINAYCENPLEDVVYLELDLTPALSSPPP
jgi:GNAT superfamily N-acetyltransferase